MNKHKINLIKLAAKITEKSYAEMKKLYKDNIKEFKSTIKRIRSKMRRERRQKLWEAKAEKPGASVKS